MNMNTDYNNTTATTVAKFLGTDTKITGRSAEASRTIDFPSEAFGVSMFIPGYEIGKTVYPGVRDKVTTILFGKQPDQHLKDDKVTKVAKEAFGFGMGFLAREVGKRMFRKIVDAVERKIDSNSKRKD